MYTVAFESAINHAMLYEVGGHWDLSAPGAEEGLIDTRAHRSACGYTNDPDDNGGETKYGIAKNANPHVDVTNLDWEGAKAIYYSNYWLTSKSNKMDGRVAALQFDGAINHGAGQASKFIQRAIGVNDDGAIGPVTLAAMAQIDPIELCNAVCDMRVEFYHNIVANKPKQAKYLNGWLRRVKEMREFTTDLANNF
jgi:lysozyme family protein